MKIYKPFLVEGTGFEGKEHELVAYILHVRSVIKYVEREMALLCVNVTLLIPGRRLLRRMK
jgi:predicted metal-dependent hydrolase